MPLAPKAPRPPSLAQEWVGAGRCPHSRQGVNLLSSPGLSGALWAGAMGVCETHCDPVTGRGMCQLCVLSVLFPSSPMCCSLWEEGAKADVLSEGKGSSVAQ